MNGGRVSDISASALLLKRPEALAATTSAPDVARNERRSKPFVTKILFIVVRATVLDAFSYNYRVALVEEGCFDRSQASHAINLCDMNAKYADVVTCAEALAFFDSLPAGLFELPKGGRHNPPPALSKTVAD